MVSIALHCIRSPLPVLTFLSRENPKIYARYAKPEAATISPEMRANPDRRPNCGALYATISSCQRVVDKAAPSAVVLFCPSPRIGTFRLPSLSARGFFADMHETNATHPMQGSSGIDSDLNFVE
ncbi:hypothetical protein Trydic_g23485 [Trypoxylus dichotomus]